MKEQFEEYIEQLATELSKSRTEVERKTELIESLQLNEEILRAESIKQTLKKWWRAIEELSETEKDMLRQQLWEKMISEKDGQKTNK